MKEPPVFLQDLIRISKAFYVFPKRFSTETNHWVPLIFSVFGFVKGTTEGRKYYDHFCMQCSFFLPYDHKPTELALFYLPFEARFANRFVPSLDPVFKK